VIARSLTALSLLWALATPAAEPTPIPGFGPRLAATTAEAAPEAPPSPVVPVVPPRSNEAMEFQVSYLGVPMGKVRLFAGNVDSTVAPVFLQAQTTSIFAIVTLRQQLSSYLDVRTGLPRSGQLAAVEGSYRHTDTVAFDRVANQAKVREVGKYDKSYLIDVPPDATDFIALVYRLRTLPLEDGARYEFNVLSGRDQNKVLATVLGREKLETKAGTFQAVKVRVPTGFTGKFSEKNPTFVWFSDDDRRVVVRITADFAIGNATANLVSYAPGTAAIPASAPGAAPSAIEPASAPATAPALEPASASVGTR
jgi:hypothetical protein